MTVLVRSIVALALAILVVMCLRWIFRQSRAIGAMVWLAVGVRLVAGLALFFISYLNLPIARSLQVGNGFWAVALDATGYFQMAAARAAHTTSMFALDHTLPSPFFINVLAIWMSVVGVSPVAAMFLNLCLYVALVALIVRSVAPVDDWRRDLPCIVSVFAFSFSPVLMFDATQPLKDELSVFLVGIACLGVLAVRPLFTRLQTAREWLLVAAGSLALGAAVYGTSGIRWYFGFIMWGALALGFCVGTAIAMITGDGDTRSRPHRVGAGMLVVSIAFAAFAMGSGPFYRTVIGANLDRLLAPRPGETGVISRLKAIPSDLINWAQITRTGFLRSGGGTNVVVPLHADAEAGLEREQTLVAREHASAAYQEKLAELERMRAAGTPLVTGVQPLAEAAPGTGRSRERPASSPEHNEAARAIPVTRLDHLKTIATGLALMLLPTVVFEPLTGVTVPAGRGLLSFADVDTVFLDLMTVAIGVLLWKRRENVRDGRVAVIFGVMLSVITAVLLGYVVTNFGTLWRMRSLALMPLWLTALAVSPRRHVPARIEASTSPSAAT